MERAALSRRARWAVLGGLVATVTLGPAGCTSFDDAVADQGYFDVAGAVLVCARVFSCPHLGASLRQSLGVPIDDSNFSMCLSWLAGPSPAPPGGFALQAARLREIAEAASCEATFADLDVRVFDDDDARCAGSSADRCTDQGDVLDCHEHRLIRCPGAQFAADSQCFVSGSLARCAVSSCPPLSQVFTCVGATLSLCGIGSKLRQELDCAALDQNCLTTSETLGAGVVEQQIAICTAADNAAPTSVCSGHGLAACTPDGAAMVLCNHVGKVEGYPAVGAVEVVYPCEKELGWRCEEVTGGPLASCVRPDAECTPVDAGVNRCDGDHLEVCLAGRRERVDCTAAGARCHEGAAGASCTFAP